MFTNTQNSAPLANPNTIVNTPTKDYGLISTVTTEDGYSETTISGPKSGTGSRTQVTLSYKGSDFNSIKFTQYDLYNGIKTEKGNVHLYSKESLLELKRFLNEVITLDISNLKKGKLVYSNAVFLQDDITQHLQTWYDNDPDNCKNLLLKVLAVKGHVSGQDLQNLVDRRKQVEFLKRITNDDGTVFEELKTIYKKSQNEKLIEEFLKDNSWILGLSLDSVQYNGIDESLEAIKKIQEQVPGRPEHNFDILTETTTVNIVELKLPTEKLFNQGVDSHGNPIWNPLFFQHVTQVQNYKRVLEQIGDSGMLPSGKKIIFPNTFLVIGRLSDMKENHVKVFEMYRKNLIEPKIFTYDEILNRAERIVSDKKVDIVK